MHLDVCLPTSWVDLNEEKANFLKVKAPNVWGLFYVQWNGNKISAPCLKWGLFKMRPQNERNVISFPMLLVSSFHSANKPA